MHIEASHEGVDNARCVNDSHLRLNSPRRLCLLALLASSCAALFSFGCSVVVDADRPQCSTDAECVARGPDFAGAVCKASVCSVPTRWSCLDEPSEPQTSTGSFNVTFLVRDTVSQLPQVGISARVCRRLDVNCAESVTDMQSTDANGYVSLTVPAEFEGYVRFEGETIASALYFFDPPVRSDLPNLRVSLSSPETAAGLTKLTGAEPDPALGLVLVTVYDCMGDPAEGVTINADKTGASAKSFYIRNGLPSATATATDDTGYGGIVNAATGTATFSSSYDQGMIGSVTVLVQPGAMTIAHIVPNGT